jgi:receptor protein-tyrosine kinase/non-specific protein-tyrosine kinase
MSKLEEALEKANIIRESQAHHTREKTEKVNKSDIKKISGDNILILNEDDSPVAEEYRRLKSMVIRQTKSDFLNTIMITSSIESEGKSTTAINLAIALAQEIDHSILLVDADLRKPMVHNYLGIEYKYGLSDYLTRDIDLSEVLINTEIENLVLLPAGRKVSNPVELLSSSKMKALVGELKHRYMDRYVILDVPPALPFADIIALGAMVDGVIFVIQEGRAKKSTIQEALDMLRNLNVLGAVYNNVSESKLNGQYSRHYKDYSNYMGKKRK